MSERRYFFLFSLNKKIKHPVCRRARTMFPEKTDQFQTNYSHEHRAWIMLRENVISLTWALPDTSGRGREHGANTENWLTTQTAGLLCEPGFTDKCVIIWFCSDKRRFLVFLVTAHFISNHKWWRGTWRDEQRGTRDCVWWAESWKTNSHLKHCCQCSL